MEMTKKPNETHPNSTSEREALLPPPAPFSSERERQELEHAFLSQRHPPSTLLPSPPPQQSAQVMTEHQQQYYVPTAIPISDDTSFTAHVAPTMAMATPVAASLPPSDVAAASGTNYNYQSSNNNQKQKSYEDEDKILVQPEPLNSTDTMQHLLPTAPNLPTPASNLPATHQLTTSIQLRYAQYRGKILSDEEKAGIARAQRERNAIRYHAGEAVKVANDVAFRKVGRRDEGLTVDERIHNVPASANNLDDCNLRKAEDDDVRPYGTTVNGQRGYEVAEYDVKQYDVDEEYDVAEYKSVYD